MKKFCRLIVCLVLLAGVAPAQPGPGDEPGPPPQQEMSMRRPPGPPGMQRGRRAPEGPMRLPDLDRLVEPLQLDTDQVERLRQILMESGRESLTREGRIKALDFTIKAKLMAEEVSLREIRELHEELFREKAAGAWAQLEAEMAIREVLTPEQARKYRLLKMSPPRPPMRRGPQQGPRDSGPGGPGPEMRGER